MLVQEAVSSGARLFKACEIIGLSIRTLQRWREGGKIKRDLRKEAAKRRVPPNKLSMEKN